jgi:LuxR family maltose regulon positive regulatory protein
VLFLSYNTIHSHTKSIYQKLRVSSRPAAIERARELGAL